MPDEHANARARIAQLEKDPKHTGPNPVHNKLTEGHSLDDPKHQGNPHLDPGWKQDAEGEWSHPDYKD